VAYELSTFVLPCGATALRANAVGHLGKEDVAYFMEQVGKGKPFHALPMLVATQQMKSLSPEGRKAMSGVNPDAGGAAWCALVLLNPVVRVVTSFLMRINRNPKLKVFSKEDDAIRWLNERALEDAAKKAT
jgi:hypothetical protein